MSLFHCSHGTTHLGSLAPDHVPHTHSRGLVALESAPGNRAHGSQDTHSIPLKTSKTAFEVSPSWSAITLLSAVRSRPNYLFCIL